MPEVVPKRPLASLTKEECQTLFALAFGYAPPLERLNTWAYSGHLLISAVQVAIILYPDGQIFLGNRDTYTFNARKVITQLDAYNVAFGDDSVTN